MFGTAVFGMPLFYRCYTALPKIEEKKKRKKVVYLFFMNTDSYFSPISPYTAILKYRIITVLYRSIMELQKIKPKSTL